MQETCRGTRRLLKKRKDKRGKERKKAEHQEEFLEDRCGVAPPGLELAA